MALLTAVKYTDHPIAEVQNCIITIMHYELIKT